MATFARDPCQAGIILAAPECPPCAARAKPWILVATILGSSMAFIDGTVVNVALPELQRSLGATITEIQWIVEAYALFLAALLLVGGALGDQFGRRRTFALGVVIFAFASGLCGLATTPIMLITARALQGIGGALLVPGSLALISASFSQAQRGRAIGTWSGFSAITSGLGLLLGGWLIDYASWRVIFFINIPLGMIALAITFRYVSESRAETWKEHLDWPGAFAVTVALGGFTYGLIESTNLGFTHPLIVATLAGGFIAMVLFVVVEHRSRTPMMPLSIFRSRSFSGANALTFLLYMAFGGALYFLPLNLIQVQGYSALAAGAATLPFILLMFFLSGWSGGLADRYGPKKPLVIGPSIVGVGLVLMAVPEIDSNYWVTFFPGIAVLGFGLAVTVAPLTMTVMGSVSKQRAGLASGINNAVSRTAGLVAIAALGPIIFAVFKAQLVDYLNALDLSNAVLQAFEPEIVKLGGAQPPVNIPGNIADDIRHAVDRAFVAGFRTVMWITAVLAVLSTITAILFIEHKTSPETTPQLSKGEST